MTYVGGALNHNNSTNTTVTVPIGSAAGQVAILDVGWNSSLAAFVSLGGTVTGWTQIGTEQTDASVTKRVYRKVLVGGDPGGTVTLNLDTLVKNHISVEVYSGIDTTNPIDTFGFSTEAGTSASHVGPTITTASNGCTIYTSVTDKNGALTTFTPPTGFTLRDSGFETSVAVSSATADKVQPSAGAITPDHWVADTATDKAIVSAIALKAAVGGGSTPPTATATSATTEIADATGSAAGQGGTLSYSWSQVSGPTVTLNTSTPGKATFPRPVPMPNDIVLQVTVTETPSGFTDTTQVTFPADAGGSQSHMVWDGGAWV